MTRADQIREMDDCELANFVCDIPLSCNMCRCCSKEGCRVMEYLQEEIQDKENS